MSNQKVEPIYMAIGRNITKRRLTNNWSQSQLGEMLDPPVTRACIANMELGHQRTMLHVLDQLANIFGCHLAQLVSGKRRRRAVIPCGRRAEFGKTPVLERR